jgi:serine/threonine protein kinase
MSPEQARGEDVDTRTDLFSLGAVIYEMATGTQAFGGSTHAVVFDAILNHTPPVLINLNPLVPLRLEEIINTLLEKDREMRCQHASDLQAELKRLRRDLDSGTMMSAVGASRAGVSGASTARASASRQPSAPAVPPPAPSQSSWRYAITALVLLIVAAIGFMMWSRGQQAPATVTPQPATGTPVPATPQPLPTTPAAPRPDDRAAAPRPDDRAAAAPNAAPPCRQPLQRVARLPRIKRRRHVAQ